MKICRVGTEMIRVGGWTDRLTKLIVAFRNFVKAPKRLE